MSRNPALLAAILPAGEADPADPELRAGEVATYTTAPAEYDWTGFGTRTVLHFAGYTARGGKPIRKVATQTARTEAQRGRYASGLHMCADATEWAKLVRFGLVRLACPNCGESSTETGACSVPCGR